MPESNKRADSQDHVARRKVLQTLGIAGSAGVAGCSSLLGGGGDGGGSGDTGDGDSGDGDSGDGDSGGDGSSGELGERLGTLESRYITGSAETPFWEATMPTFTGFFEELGILNHNITPGDGVSLTEDVYGDERTMHLNFISHGAAPDRLDPQGLLRRNSIEMAGDQPGDNLGNIANTQYTDQVFWQQTAPNPENRQAHINRALAVMSHEQLMIPVLPLTISGAFNTDTVNPGGVGQGGVSRTNPIVFGKTSSADGDSYTASVLAETLETTNHMILTATEAQTIHNRMFRTPLFVYDENLDWRPALADDFELADEGRELTVTLKDDITFSNGDPIQSSDVRFTINWIQDNRDVFTNVAEFGIEGIETPDDTTVVFNLESANPPFLTRELSKWGIVSEDAIREQGGVDDPGSWQPDPHVSSGPFEIGEFEAGSFLEAIPVDNHPVVEPESTVTLQGFADPSTAVQSFLGGEIDVLVETSIASIARIEDEMSNAETQTISAFTPMPLFPQNSYPPCQFQEFREAIASSFDRELLNEVGVRGASDPEAVLGNVVLPTNHPNHPDNPEEWLKFPADASGDIDHARSVLEDAGWAWDDNGELHYPPDKDLSPRWPQGELPQPEDFDCLNENSEYVPPWERGITREEALEFRPDN